MGGFLTTPNKTKHSEDNENIYLRYGSCGMQGWRIRMEDAHITDISQGIENNIEIFGVFDGHGGKEVSQFVKRHFTEEFMNYYNSSGGNIKQSLSDTFLQMDKLMQTQNGKNELYELAKLSKEEDEQQNSPSLNSQADLLMRQAERQKSPEINVAMSTGCTACVCVIDEKNKKMYFANSGDSRVVLCKKGIAYPMSIDHKPELESEKNRITTAGGWISEGRIKGNLNLSRSLGDLEYKQNNNLLPHEQMITAFPDIVEENLTNDCEFIILGCDGIWDCLTNQEACDYVKKEIGKTLLPVKLSFILEMMMDSIIATDLYNPSGVGCDNMTCMIVQFKKIRGR